MTAVPDYAPPPQPTEPVDPSSGWREPARLIELRWGRYEERYGVGLGLMIASVVLSGYLWQLGAEVVWLSALALAVAGVVVLPARRTRIVLASGAIILASYLWVFVWSDVFIGVTAILMLLAWLVVRERSGPAYAIGLPAVLIATLVLVVLVRWGLLPDFSHVFTAVLLLAVCGVAWLVRALEPRFGARVELARTTAQAQRSRLGAASEAEAIAAQVRTMAALQAAWDSEHPGQPMPAIAVAPTTGVAAAGNNVLAVLALVFGLLGGGLVAVVLGHMARGQIRRTGEHGDGMAIAGLVLGYLGLAVGLVYLVAVAGVLASLS